MSSKTTDKTTTVSRSKRATSFKLTDTALGILSTLSTNRGIAKSAVIENLLRTEWQYELERERK